MFRVALGLAFGDEGDLFVATDGDAMRTHRSHDPTEGIVALLGAEPSAPCWLADAALAAAVPDLRLPVHEPSTAARRAVEQLLYGLAWGRDASSMPRDLLAQLSHAARELTALDVQALAQVLPVSVRFRSAVPVRGVSVAWFVARDGESHGVVLAASVGAACAAAARHFEGDHAGAARIDHRLLQLRAGAAPLADAWLRWASLARVPELIRYADGREVAIETGDVLQMALAIRTVAHRVRHDERGGRDAVKIEFGEVEAVGSIVTPADPPPAGQVDAEFARGALLFVALADAADEDDAALYHYDQALELGHLLPVEHAVRAHLGRGTILEARAEVEFALQDYAAALRLDPQCADAYFRRGNCRAMQGALPLALGDFDRLVSLRPDAEAYRLRGLVHMHLGNSAAALADEQRSAALASA